MEPDTAFPAGRAASQPPPPPSAVPLPRCAGEDVGAIATRALLAELDTFPKPGLVSPVDAGSHDDMDAGTFCRSVAALAPFFARLAEAGAGGAELPALRAIGLEAEAAMLLATGGVNTHRGAIFALGLLCAAAGAGAPDPATHVRTRWGAALRAERPSGSHGARAMAAHGVGGARGEAAAGFPTAVRVGLPALREALAAMRPAPPLPLVGKGQGWRSGGASWIGEELDDRAKRSAEEHAPTPTPSPCPQGGGEQAARVQAFFALLAACDDTNLLHRGGVAGLAFARREAAAFLAAGGVARPDWLPRAVALHRAFVERRLSPGGSADLLAVTLFLDEWERRR